MNRQRISEQEINKSILNTKKRLKQLFFYNKYEISKYVLNHIINKWDKNEVIMNLRDRIIEIENENGILTSDLNELIDKRLKISPSILKNIYDKNLNKQISELKIELQEKENTIGKLIKINNSLKGTIKGFNKVVMKKEFNYEVIKGVLMDTIQKNRMTFCLRSRIGSKIKELKTQIK